MTRRSRSRVGFSSSSSFFRVVSHSSTSSGSILSVILYADWWPLRAGGQLSPQDSGTHEWADSDVDVSMPKEAPILMREFQIVENWDVIGMQGTGSHRVVLPPEITIPSHRLAADSDLWSHNPEGPTESLEHSSPLYCGALDLYEEVLRSRKLIASPFQLRLEGRLRRPITLQ